MNLLDYISALWNLPELLRKVDIMSAEIEALTDAVAGIKDAVPAVAEAIDRLEAAVTAATNSGGMSQEDKAALASAIDDLRDAGAQLAAAVADANDGTDEGAVPA